MFRLMTKSIVRVTTGMLLATTTLAATTFSRIQQLPFTDPAELRRYGDHASQFAWFWPAVDGVDEPPQVVLLHGGCWLSAYSVEHIRPLATAIAHAGYEVWAPEYRRVGDGGGDPMTLEDIGAAISLLRDAESRDRPWALVGHSAGGHLALWAASNNDPVLPSPDVVIGLAPITDLAQYAAGGGSCAEALEPFMQGTPEQKPARYRDLSPAYRSSNAPVVIIQGDADPIVPVTQARAMPDATLELIPDAGHFDLIDPRGEAVQRLLEVLNQRLLR